MAIVIPIRNPKFQLGQLFATLGATDALLASGQDIGFFLQRHCMGDWGDLDTEDKAMNEQSLAHGGKLMSSYKTLLGVKVWLITEGWNESRVTTLLLPEDY